MELIRMRTKQILLFGLVTCSLTGNMVCKDADSEKRCIDNVRMISRVTGDPLPGDTLLNPIIPDLTLMYMERIWG